MGRSCSLFGDEGVGFTLGFFEIGSCELFVQECPQILILLNSWDYRREPLVPCGMGFFDNPQ
jgi:hypothetical protein